MFFSKKKTRFKVLKKNINLLEQGKGDFKSRLFLFFSVFILFISFLLIFSDNIDLVSPGKTLGDWTNPVTWTILAIGVFINFLCVPLLYWSSYQKFKKNDNFWDMEIFWILPLSFFGTFFQYVSDLPHIIVTIPFSLITVLVVHVYLMIVSKGLITQGEQFENTSRYFASFTYLTAYYVVLTIIVLFFNLFEKMSYWVG